MVKKQTNVLPLEDKAKKKSTAVDVPEALRKSDSAKYGVGITHVGIIRANIAHNCVVLVSFTVKVNMSLLNTAAHYEAVFLGNNVQKLNSKSVVSLKMMRLPLDAANNL